MYEQFILCFWFDIQPNTRLKCTLDTFRKRLILEREKKKLFSRMINLKICVKTMGHIDVLQTVAKPLKLKLKIDRPKNQQCWVQPHVCRVDPGCNLLSQKYRDPWLIYVQLCPSYCSFKSPFFDKQIIISVDTNYLFAD